MQLTEFRVVLPLTVEEYQVGQLFAVAEASVNETGGGEGIEVLKNEPYTDVPLLGGKYTSGQYTYKIYHVNSKLPRWLRAIIPSGMTDIHEEAWNAYPYCRTVLTNPGYMKDSFSIVIETLHAPGRGDMQNAHELPQDKLAVRNVVVIDIANDPVPASDYKTEYDPKLFRSEKTGRGQLTDPDWKAKVEPVMTCYKLVTFTCKFFPFTSKIESYAVGVYRRMFTTFHRQLFCSLDGWHGMTIQDIRELEDKTKRDLDKALKEGKVRGSTA